MIFNRKELQEIENLKDTINSLCDLLGVSYGCPKDYTGTILNRLKNYYILQYDHRDNLNTRVNLILDHLGLKVVVKEQIPEKVVLEEI